jgi:hypothetical protein
MRGGTMIAKNIKLLAVALLVAVGSLSCSGELTDNAAPVELVVTHTADIGVIDVSPTTEDPDCEEDLGTINMLTVPKNSSVTGPRTQVRVNRYRVSYRRTDGGTVVPPSFVRSIDTLVGPAGSNTVFRLFELGVQNVAPLVSLQPGSGGRDPETLRPYVRLEVILEVFGETLAGDNVYDSTSIPFEFCYGCGCS